MRWQLSPPLGPPTSAIASNTFPQPWDTVAFCLPRTLQVTTRMCSRHLGTSQTAWPGNHIPSLLGHFSSIHSRTWLFSEEEDPPLECLALGWLEPQAVALLPGAGSPTRKCTEAILTLQGLD